MKEYISLNDAIEEFYGDNITLFYHKEKDRYIVFDSQEELDEERKTATLTMAKLGEYERPVAVLNTSIITDYGDFKYQPIDLKDAQIIAKHYSIESAVGHQATADILTTLLEREVQVNRVQYKQPVGHKALVFKLRGRIEEGRILTCQEIEQIGYDFGVLTRTA